MKHFLLSLTMAVMPMGAFAQFGVVAPLHVSGKQLVDQGGHTVVLHGVMDTPNPYFNRYRWGSACNDGTVAACINYFDKVFGAIQNPAKGTYCNIFRLHLDPCWTNNGHASGEADISKFSADRLRKYLQTLYWPIAQKALNHGLYVVVRPPGVCPKDLKVGDAYQQYLKTVWGIVSSNANFKNNSGVVSLELANEPVHVYNQYGQSSSSALHDYFQPIVNIIRQNGFKGVIWIPGTGYQSQYQDYASHPINDGNFGYAVHVYPGWYGASDKSYDHNTFIRNFQNQVPVVTSKPILVSEIDWSPEKAGAGKYNEFGQWVASNYGTWGTASTSKWGNAWKAVMDHFGNISMTLSSNEDYVDIDAFLKNGTIKANFNENVECCAKACFYWYYEYSKKNYAHKSESSSSSSSSTDNTSGSTSTITGDNLVKAWGNVNDVIPAGWTAVDNGSQRQVGSQSRGPRVMQFYQGGDMTTAFYVREISPDKAGYIEYGGQSGYTLPLVYGEYQLNCNVTAWKGSPYVKVEVFDPTNTVVASTIVKANGCVNGTRNTAIKGSTRVNLSFYSMIKGNYKLRFTPVADAKGNGGNWEEALVGNVGLYYKENPLAFKNANTVPEGWKILDAGQKVAAGAASLGPRIFQFSQGGYLPTGLYIRQSDASKAAYAEVGTVNGYGLSLKKGSYHLSYYAIGWAGNPYVKCEVFDESNNCLGSQIIRCNNNVGKSLSANTYGASYGVVNFYANHTGYYHFRWTPVADAYGNSGTWLEVVFGHIKIQQGSASAKSMTIGFNDGTTTAIDNAVESGGKKDEWYNLQGQRVANPSRGIYIHNGKKVICR